mmetsp:Transcript_1213/g.2378  ORF Transcript_1213/g.2378 Transcript_1213/m.2378 type:complete len:357 (+) Transcript_1213:63-1133(+)
MSFSARTDSGSANNPALNLTGAPAVTITFAPETISGGQGDLLLEGSETSPDPDTVVYIDGVAYEFSFALTGTLPTAKRDGAQQVPDQLEGESIYLIVVQDYPSNGDTTRMAYLPDYPATEAEMNDFGNGAIDIQSVDSAPSPTPVCFCAGTLIKTPRGDVPVEDLIIGDLVTTHEGNSRILWTGNTAFEWSNEDDEHKPFVIPANAFGPDSPHRDLHVSPHHKIAFTSSQDEDVQLCPVKGLNGWLRIRQRRGCRSTRYHHILLERHAIVNANGVAAESFYPGNTALKMLSRADRENLLARLGHGTPILEVAETYGPMVGAALTVRQAAESCRTLVALQPPGTRSARGDIFQNTAA